MPESERLGRFVRRARWTWRNCRTNPMGYKWRDVWAMSGEKVR